MKQTFFAKLFQVIQSSFLCSASMKNNLEHFSCIIYWFIISDFVNVSGGNGRDVCKYCIEEWGNRKYRKYEADIFWLTISGGINFFLLCSAKGTYY